MIRYRTRSTAPHIRIELADTVSGTEVRRELDALPDDLATMPDGFVAMAVWSELALIRESALGPLFYYVTALLYADPGLFVLVDGGRSPHPGLRSFIEQVGVDDQVTFVASREQAAERIEAYRRRSS